MKRVILVLSLILGLFFSSFVSAEMTLSQPSSIYNLGDSLDVKATVKATENSVGFFEMNLVCSSENNFYRVPLTLDSGKEKIIETSLILTRDFVSSIGTCAIKASYSGQSVTSQSFKISDSVVVSLDLEKIDAEAGKAIEIKGKAVKENGKKLEGFVDLEIFGRAIKSSGTVVNGVFSANLVFPDNSKAEVYTLKVKVYEKYEGKETNNGEASGSIAIKQVAKKVDVFIRSQSLNPEEKVEYKATILDQAGDLMMGSAAVKIYNAGNELVEQKIADSGEDSSLILKRDSSSGYWKIKAETLGFSDEKLFYVQELERASFELVNDTLIVTNTGNIIYKKQVEISIGDYSEIKTFNLKVGDSVVFRLSAPDGKYDIKIDDGTSSVDDSSVFLTGSFIGIRKIKGDFDMFRNYPIVWAFLIAVAGMFVMLLLRKDMKQTVQTLTTSRTGGVEKIKLDESLESKVFDSKLDIAGEAEHVLVLDGKKQLACLFSIDIKNFSEARNSKDILNKIIDIIKSAKGSSYVNGNFITGLFLGEREMDTIRTSQEVSNYLNEGNRKFRIKINYGIGINSGELIVKKEGKLKFATVGNILSLAKKIASVSEDEVLLSEVTFRKVMNIVKAEKTNKGDLKVYKITRIVEREKHEGFLKGFLERNE